MANGALPAQPSIPTPSPSQQASTTSVEAFQAVIDTAVAKNQSLYDQRDALKAQILALNLQLNDLNAQIAASETDDVKKARASVRALDMIAKGTGGPLMRQFGG